MKKRHPIHRVRVRQKRMPRSRDKVSAASTAMPDPPPHFFEEVDGASATGEALVMVKKADVTALSLIPDFSAMALMVLVAATVIAPE